MIGHQPGPLCAEIGCFGRRSATGCRACPGASAERGSARNTFPSRELTSSAGCVEWGWSSHEPRARAGWNPASRGIRSSRSDVHANLSAPQWRPCATVCVSGATPCSPCQSFWRADVYGASAKSMPVPTEDGGHSCWNEWSLCSNKPEARSALNHWTLLRPASSVRSVFRGNTAIQKPREGPSRNQV
jgi:hypothetical protein